MTTGEKIAALRKSKGITQEELAEMLKISRQSVSRWEMDAVFPETEKMIKLSKLFGCSIDFLLNSEMQEQDEKTAELSAGDCLAFIRDCTYCFLATADASHPRLRPMGMLYADGRFLYIGTDSRKKVYSELLRNPLVELASYNLHTRRWIRIAGKAQIEPSGGVREQMTALYPMIGQEYPEKEEIFFVIFRIEIENACVD